MDTSVHHSFMVTKPCTKNRRYFIERNLKNSEHGRDPSISEILSNQKKMINKQSVSKSKEK